MTNDPSDGGASVPQELGLSAWERIHERIIGYREETERIISGQSLEGPCRILDLACGTGRHLIEAARLGHHCTGVDQQEWKIRRAQEESTSLGLNINFACADMRSLEIASVHDLVVCLYAFSVMTKDADVAAVFATANRALRPGGSFVFNVLNRAADSGFPPQAGDPGHLRAFELDEILDYAKKSDFRLHDAAMFDVAGIKALDIFVCVRRVTVR